MDVKQNLKSKYKPMSFPNLFFVGFHGFGQNEQKLDLFVKSFSKKLKAKYMIIQGPYVLPPKTTDKKEEVKRSGNAYSNFTYSNVEYKEIMSEDWIKKEPQPNWKSDLELKTIMDSINAKLEYENYEDCKLVFFGFSEGGMIAAQMAHTFPDCTYCTIIQSSPFPPKIFQHNEKSKIPLILVYSERDSVVPPSQTLKWKSLFEKTCEISHEKGHKVYVLSTLKNKIANL